MYIMSAGGARYSIWQLAIGGNCKARTNHLTRYQSVDQSPTQEL